MRNKIIISQCLNCTNCLIASWMITQISWSYLTMQYCCKANPILKTQPAIDMAVKYSSIDSAQKGYIKYNKIKYNFCCDINNGMSCRDFKSKTTTTHKIIKEDTLEPGNKIEIFDPVINLVLLFIVCAAVLIYLIYY